MKHYSPVISIITVVYNGSDSIEETIRSVLSLSYKKINFFIIDGASSDGTVEIINKYADKLTKFVSEPDKGIYDAMNKGWALCEQDSYILFLGSGDKILSLPDMEKYKDHDVIVGNVFIGKRKFRSKVDFRLRLGNTLHHQALLTKKSVHIDPPFSLDYPIYGDFDFNQRLYKKKLCFIKDESFLAYASEGGVSSRRNESEMLRVVKKNYGVFYAFLARVFYLMQNVRNG